MAETVIAIAVPEAAAPIQHHRRLYKADGVRDMPPHITLLSPFTDTSVLAVGRIREVRRVLSQFEPVDFTLERTAYFENGEERILYLVPEPSDPFRAMTEALAAQFPEHKPYGGAFAGIVPHVTVALSSDPDVVEGIKEELGAHLPIPARAEEAGLWELTEDVWRLRSKLLFGVPDVDYREIPLFN